MEAIGVASKQNPSADFVDELFERGRRMADEWVRLNLAKVGVTSSFDVDAEVELRLKGNAEARQRFKDERSKSSVFDTEGEPARQRRVHS